MFKQIISRLTFAILPIFGYKLLSIDSTINIGELNFFSFYRSDRIETNITPKIIIENSKSKIKSNLTPAKIREKIEAVPFSMRREFSQKFKGIEVEWSGYMYGNEEVHNSDYGKQLKIFLSDEKSKISFNTIWFTTVTDQYPELATLTYKSKLKVSGQIVSVDSTGSRIELNVDAIQFIEDNPEVP